jgi:hypothetical protein
MLFIMRYLLKLRNLITLKTSIFCVTNIDLATTERF